MNPSSDILFLAGLGGWYIGIVFVVFYIYFL